MRLVYFQACSSSVYVRLTVSLPLNLVHAHRIFHVCVCVFVGSCLATKVYRQFASYGKGLGHHKVGQ